MLFDWFTVGAQVLNFMILAWLLKHFLYKPVLEAIDAREKRIAAETASTDEREAATQRASDELEQRSKAFDSERAALLDKASENARVERERLLDAARQAADGLTALRHSELRQDARTLGEAIRRRTQEEVFAITRRTLVDLADIDLERRICEVFVTRLRALPGEAKDDLAKAVMRSAQSPLVRSAFDLPDEQRNLIRAVLNEILEADIPLRFETSPGEVGGIDLIAGGRGLKWSIAGYLGALQSGIDELLKPASPPPSEAASTIVDTATEPGQTLLPA